MKLQDLVDIWMNPSEFHTWCTKPLEKNTDSCELNTVSNKATNIEILFKKYCSMFMLSKANTQS